MPGAVLMRHTHMIFILLSEETTVCKVQARSGGCEHQTGSQSVFDGVLQKNTPITKIRKNEGCIFPGENT